LLAIFSTCNHLCQEANVKRIQEFSNLEGGNDSGENYFAGAGEQKGEGKTNLEKQLPVELSLFLLSHSGISSPDIS
jgi:hypothetical protein